jgi:hypothetical protein
MGHFTCEEMIHSAFASSNFPLELRPRNIVISHKETNPLGYSAVLLLSVRTRATLTRRRCFFTALLGSTSIAIFCDSHVCNCNILQLLRQDVERLIVTQLELHLKTIAYERVKSIPSSIFEPIL